LRIRPAWKTRTVASFIEIAPTGRRRLLKTNEVVVWWNAREEVNGTGMACQVCAAGRSVIEPPRGVKRPPVPVPRGDMPPSCMAAVRRVARHGGRWQAVFGDASGGTVGEASVLRDTLPPAYVRVVCPSHESVRTAGVL